MAKGNVLKVSFPFSWHCHCRTEQIACATKNLWRIAKLICPDWKTLQLKGNAFQVRKRPSTCLKCLVFQHQPWHSRNPPMGWAMASSGAWRPWQSSSNLGSGTRIKVRILPWKCQKMLTFAILCHICHICHDGIHWSMSMLLILGMDKNGLQLMIDVAHKMIQACSRRAFDVFLPTIRSFTTRARAAKMSDAWRIWFTHKQWFGVYTFDLNTCRVLRMYKYMCTYIYIYMIYDIPLHSSGFPWIQWGPGETTNHESVKTPTLKRNCRLGTWEPNLAFGEAPDPHVLDIRPSNVLTSESHIFQKTGGSHHWCVVFQNQWSTYIRVVCWNVFLRERQGPTGCVDLGIFVCKDACFHKQRLCPPKPKPLDLGRQNGVQVYRFQESENAHNWHQPWKLSLT